MNWIIFGLALWAVLQVPIGLIVGDRLHRSSRKDRGAVASSANTAIAVPPPQFLDAYKLPPRRARRRDMAHTFSLRFAPVSVPPVRFDAGQSRAQR